MANNALGSPGLYTAEIFAQVYQNPLGRTIPCLVGGGSWGPLDKPISITAGAAELKSKIGLPLAADYGTMAAFTYARKHAKLLYLRCGSGAVKADVDVIGSGVSSTGQAASGAVTFLAKPVDGNTITLKDSAGTSKTFEFDLAAAATGTVTFTGRPNDGDTITLNDGQGGADSSKTVEFDACTPTGTITLTSVPANGNCIRIRDQNTNDSSHTKLFEFQTGSVTSGNVKVDTTGLTTGAQAATALAAAINGVYSQAGNFTVYATVSGAVVTVWSNYVHLNSGGLNTNSTTAADFVNKCAAAAGTNGAGTNWDSSGTTTVVTSLGKASPAAGGSHIVCPIGGSAAACATWLSKVIPGTGIAYNGYTPADTSIGLSVAVNSGVVTFTNDVSAPSGNQTIIKVGSNFTVNGMSGGAASGVASGNVQVLVGNSSTDSCTNFIAAVAGVSNFQITAAQGATSPYPVASLVASTVGTSGNNAIVANGAALSVSGMSGGQNSVPGGTGVCMTIQALYTGTKGDQIQVTLTQPTKVIGALATNFDIVVSAVTDDSGIYQVVEHFYNLNLDSSDVRYAPDVVGNGIQGEINPSQWIRLVYVAQLVPLAGLYQLGIKNAGANGLPSNASSSDYIGVAADSAGRPTGIQTLYNTEAFSFNILAAPGVTNATIIDALIDVRKQRGKCMLFLDTPFGASDQQAVDWHNGVSAAFPNAPSQPINDDRTAIFYPWVKTYVPELKASKWLPPSGLAVGVAANTDATRGPWFPMAGTKRAALDTDYVKDVELMLSQSSRDLLLTLPNRINPIVYKSSVNAFVIWGNVTTFRAANEADPRTSIHMMRMLVHAEALVDLGIEALVFDPNDAQLWDEYRGIVEPMLEYIKQNRGLETYSITIDATNNSDSVKAQKLAVANIELKAVGVAERILSTYSLGAPGTYFSS